MDTEKKECPNCGTKMGWNKGWRMWECDECQTTVVVREIPLGIELSNEEWLEFAEMSHWDQQAYLTKKYLERGR